VKTIDACKRDAVLSHWHCLVGGLQASAQNNVSFVRRTLTRLSFSVARALTKKSLIHIRLKSMGKNISCKIKKSLYVHGNVDYVSSIRGSVSSTQGLRPTMTARGHSIGISIDILPQTLVMSIDWINFRGLAREFSFFIMHTIFFLFVDNGFF
jgi:hypothetical protein